MLGQLWPGCPHVNPPDLEIWSDTMFRIGLRAGASSAAIVVARSSAAGCDKLDDTPEVNLVPIPDVAVTDVKLYALQHLNDLGFPSSKVAPPAHFGESWPPPPRNRTACVLGGFLRSI